MAESKEELKSLLMRIKETLMPGKTEAEREGDNRGWDGWMAYWLNDMSMSKVRGTRDQIANIRWIMEKAREFQKNIYFCFFDYAKDFDCVDHNQLWKILRCEYQNTWPASWEICMQVRKQQFELDMEQQTASKKEKSMSRLYIVTLLI